MKRLIMAVTATALLAGCAARPPERDAIASLPILESDWSRVYVSAGEGEAPYGVRMWSVHQVGPVFFNGEQVGTTAKGEYFVVDLRPGEYDVSCSPAEPEKNYTEPSKMTFTAGATHYLACDQVSKGAGVYFGAIGALASEYVTKTFLVERPLYPDSKIVRYTKVD